MEIVCGVRCPAVCLVPRLLYLLGALRALAVNQCRSENRWLYLVTVPFLSTFLLVTILAPAKSELFVSRTAVT